MIMEHQKLSIGIVLVVALVLFFALRSGTSDAVTVDQARVSDLTRSVRATGQVISKTDLDLSFNKSGTVKSVRVSVGDQVVKGQILATLDQGQASAGLTQARASLLSAQAKYQRTIEGASNEDVALAEVLLKNAQTDLQNTKNNQRSLVESARRAMLNSSLSAYSSALTPAYAAPTITGTYLGTEEGDIQIAVYNGGNNNGSFSASGLVSASGIVSTSTPQMLGTSGLFIQFPAAGNYQENWIVSIPNKKASTYLANYNAYQSALETQTSAIASAQAQVDQKQAELNLKKAAARTVDVDIAEAEVLSAEGSLQAAQAAYEDTVIRAPAPGTVTRFDTKYGELADAGKAVITVEDVSNLYIEALINEANIAYLKLEQPVRISFDAFGSEKKYTGAIAQINPSADTNDGVVNYKIKVSIDARDETIRPGMNANIDILAGEVQAVVAVPLVAVIKREGKAFVRVITDERRNRYAEREVSIGFVGDSNLVEVSTGLSAGEKIAIIPAK